MQINDEYKQLYTEMKQMFETLKTDNQELKNENALLKEEVAYLKKKLFGTKSEKSKTLGVNEQLSLFNEAELEANPEEQGIDIEIKGYIRKNKKYPGQLHDKLAKLPHEKVVLTLPKELLKCDACGKELKEVGAEFLRNEVQFIPAKLVVKEIYAMTYECRNCRKTGNTMMYTASVPQPVIPHSYASAESVAHVIKEKYVNCVPLYRQEAEWKRLGLELSRATMANWVIKASELWLMPILNEMKKDLISRHYAHCDETTVQVLKEEGKKATSKSYMWVYSSIKESDKAIRIFDYKPSREKKNVEEFFNGFSGYVISDAYTAYKGLKNITHVYCWAHARRNFCDAIPKDIENPSETIAGQALLKIKKLFIIENEIKDYEPKDKKKVRQERSKPLLDEFFAWCDKNKDVVLANSKVSKAINYCIEHQKELSEYINDGLLPMTNSLDERTIRPFAVGRKNWMFCTSVKGAEASAATYSVIESAKANGLDPYKYLVYVFKYLPNQDIVNNPEIIREFLPWGKQVQQHCK